MPGRFHFHDYININVSNCEHVECIARSSAVLSSGLIFELRYGGRGAGLQI